MRSFWIRIFATFWLIEILTITAVVTLRGRFGDFILHPLSEKALVAMAFAAEEVYQAGQCNELNPLFVRFERAYKVTAYLFDESGRAVCGVTVSPAAQRAATGPELFAMRGVPIIRDAPQIGNGNSVAAMRLNLGQATAYTFVAETHQTLSLPYRLRFQIAILTAFFVSGIITAILAKILVRPIGRLRSTALDLASGNLKARASGARRELSKGDEVAGLVRDFNCMAEQIETLVSNQKQLIRDVSHELRSPLSRLSVALELLREDTDPESMVHVERIEREADRLNRLIGQLLELSRMEAMDGAAVSKQRVELQDVVKEVVENAAYEATTRNCRVRAVVTKDITIYANAELISSALENVVRNAIRYTDQGTDVLVTLDRRYGEEGMATLTVRDFGCGVPEDKIPSLCMPFYRVDLARSSETGGTGVGLAIADRAVRLHNGRLALRNHPQGGFEVTLQLPVTGPIADHGVESGLATAGRVR
jgi:two-component system sensor histidine kinase CpxA